jgi:hypothetical protein
MGNQPQGNYNSVQQQIPHSRSEQFFYKPNNQPENNFAIGFLNATGMPHPNLFSGNSEYDQTVHLQSKLASQFANMANVGNSQNPINYNNTTYGKNR